MREVLLATAIMISTGCLVGTEAPTSSDPGQGGGSGDPGGGSAGDPGGGSAGDLTYTWIAGAFGGCSLPCGGGLQFRTVVCVRSDATVVADTWCTTLKPDTQQVCNAQSCTSVDCDPAYAFGFTTLTPTTGPAPLTVTFNVALSGTFAWDIIDFGDGTTTQGIPLTIKVLHGSLGTDDFGCVNHTYARPGTFSAGRSLIGGSPMYYPVHEATVVVLQ